METKADINFLDAFSSEVILVEIQSPRSPRDSFAKERRIDRSSEKGKVAG
jgi:hypothetical protein